MFRKAAASTACVSRGLWRLAWSAKTGEANTQLASARTPAPQDAGPAEASVGATACMHAVQLAGPALSAGEDGAGEAPGRMAAGEGFVEIPVPCQPLMTRVRGKGMGCLRRTVARSRSGRRTS